MKSVPFSVTATFATVALVAAIGYAALVGHDHAAQGHDESKPGHHMASLSEIQAFMKKAQDAEH